MATGDDLRRLALALPDTTAAPHFDRVAFKRARTFATLAADGRSANLKFDAAEQEFRCAIAPGAFAPVPGGWGRMGWTCATLAALDEATLAAALRAAWDGAAPKRRSRR